MPKKRKNRRIKPSTRRFVGFQGSTTVRQVPDKWVDKVYPPYFGGVLPYTEND